jgi:integrase
MPRSSNPAYVPKYRKHRASGQAVATINYRDFYLGPYGTQASKLEYDRLIRRWLASGRSPSFGIESDTISIAELLAAYVPFAKQYYGNTRRGEFKNMMRAMKPVLDLYGSTPANAFGPQELKTVRQGLINRGLSRTYINATIRRVVRFFRWGVGEGLLLPSVPQALAMVPGLRKGRSEARENEPVRPVDRKIVNATLPYLSPVVAAMVQLQLHTGARPGEICRLRPCDIDRSGEVWLARLSEHKTAHHDRERTIFIGPQGQRVLAPFLARAIDTPCFSPVETLAWVRAQRAARRKTPRCCGNRAGTNRQRQPRRRPGNQYTTESYYYAIQRACQKAGLEQWSPGQLRHTSGTAIRKSHGVESAQVVLGHSQVGTTQIYAEKNLELGIRVARQVG